MSGMCLSTCRTCFILDLLTKPRAATTTGRETKPCYWSQYLTWLVSVSVETAATGGKLVRKAPIFLLTNGVETAGSMLLVRSVVGMQGPRPLPIIREASCVEQLIIA